MSSTQRITVAVSNLNETVTDIHIHALFSCNVYLHRHSSSLAYVVFPSYKEATTIIETLHDTWIDSTLLHTSYDCSDPLPAPIHIHCRLAPPHITPILDKVYGPTKNILLSNDSSPFVQRERKRILSNSNLIIICAHASAIVNVAQWTSCFPNSFYVYRTNNRTKCYVAYANLEYAKMDCYHVDGRTVVLDTKDGEIYVRIATRCTTMEEVLHNSLDRDIYYEQASKHSDHVAHSVVQFLLA